MKKGDFYFYLLWQAKISARLFWHLQNSFSSPEEMFRAALSNNSLIPKKLIQEIKIVWVDEKNQRQKFDQLTNYFTLLDDCYPKLLQQIYDPPLFLFFEGNIELLKNEYLLSMVGSRHTTSYHQQAAEKIIKEFTNTPLVIVSGLAMGMDAVCHQAALENNLPTIAVLGSGIDRDSFYPKINYKLAQDIIKKNGLIISEYPEGTKPALHHFPRRNRILAGLSRATVVLSGALKSGTLITAQVAIDEGREVFALPGNINQTLCHGPNTLLLNGASIILSGQNILNFYELSGQNKPQKLKNIFTTNEKIIVDLLNIEPLYLESLLSKTTWPLSTLQATLSALEIKNIIQTNSAGQIELKW
jgi:DNA processing protein